MTADVTGVGLRVLVAAASEHGATTLIAAARRMTGELRLRQWLPFRAQQALTAGRGFVWASRVGRPPRPRGSGR